jgi:putative inorganic carbon (HCO3(-)) transporter
MEKSKLQASLYCRALEIVWLVIIFMVPLFFNPLSHQVFILNKAALLEFLVAAMLGLWLADWVLSPAGQRRLNWRNIFNSPLHLAILVFGVLVAVSTAASITPAVSFWGSYFRKAGLLTLICWILFFLIVAQQMKTRTQLFRAIYALLVSSGIVSALGILQHFFPGAMMNFFQNPNTFGDRVSSSIGNPLFLSSFLAMVTPFNLALMVYLWSKRKEGSNAGILAGLTVLLALQFWCLWLAQYSITILLYVISFVIFITIWGIVKRKKPILSLGIISLLALIIIAGVLLAPLLFQTSGVESTTEDSQPTAVAEQIGLSNLGGRVDYWRSAINIFTESPEVSFSNDRLQALRKVIGYGPETFSITFQLFLPDKYRSIFTDRALIVDRPHNDYLYLLSTTGILGLMSFLSILAIFFFLCFNYLRRATDDIDKLLLIAVVASMIQYMADIFFNPSTISPELVFWLVLAMACVIGRFVMNKQPVPVSLKQSTEPETAARVHTGRARFVLSIGCPLVFVIVGLSIAIRPFWADICVERGVRLQSAGSEQAIYAYDAATRIDPTEATYWHALAAYDYYVAQNIKGQSFKTKVMAIAAEDQYKAVELRRYSAFENYTVADICTYWAWSGATDKWPVAMSFYDKALQLFPNNAVILDKWSLALIIKGDLDEARTKLDRAARIDPKWAKTAFLSGLLLEKEGKNQEAAILITEPIRNYAANLNYFVSLCTNLALYDMVSPLGDALEIYSQEEPDDWTAQAMLGITSLFSDSIDKSLDEFNAAMRLAPDEDVGDLFRAILKLSTMSLKFKMALPSMAEEWRDKLAVSPDSDTLIPLLDQLTGNSK